jgi:hypothetical protein
MDNEDILLRFLFFYHQYFLVPDDFWEPVKISLSKEQIDNLKNNNIDEDCSICLDSKTAFKILECCRNKICVLCAKNWFNISIYCPYCKQDIRNYLNN